MPAHPPRVLQPTLPRPGWVAVYAATVACCAVAWGIATAPAPAFSAESSAAYFPGTTVIWAEAVDVPELWLDLSHSNLGRLVQDPAIAPLAQDLWAILKSVLADQEANWNVQLEELFRIPQGRLAVGLVGRADQPPALAGIMELGPEPAILRGLLEQAEPALLAAGADYSTERIGDIVLSVYRGPVGQDAAGASGSRGTSPELVLGEVRGELVFSSSLEVARHLVLARGGEAPASCLLAEPKFDQALKLATRSTARFPSHALFFADPMGLAYAMTAGNVAARASLALAPILGLNGVGGLAGALSVDRAPYDMVLHAHLVLDSPRRGIPEALALEAHTVTLPDWMPDDVAYCTAFRWNIARTMTVFETIFDGFRGQGAAQAWLDRRISQAIEVDLQKDILSELSGRFWRARWNLPDDTRLGSATVLAAELRDDHRFDATWDRLMERWADFLDRETTGDITWYSVRADDAERGERWRSRPQPTFALVGDHVVVCDRPELMRHLALTGGGNRLSGSSDCQRVRAALQTDFGVAYPALATEAYPLSDWQARVRLLQSDQLFSFLAERFGETAWYPQLVRAFEKHPLPQIDTLRRHVAPGGVAITDEESGFHYRWFSLQSASAE